MLYALNRADGGVSLMETMPAAIVIGRGKKARTLRIVRTVLLPAGFRLAAETGDTFETTVTDAAALDAKSVPGARLVFPDPAKEIARWPEETKAQIVVTAIKPIKRKDLPDMAGYRNALTMRCGRCIVDKAKARAIHRDKLRAARAPKLAALDVDYVRADERGDTAAKRAIAAQKQALRDVTADPAIDKAKTIAALAKVWPEILK